MSRVSLWMRAGLIVLALTCLSASAWGFTATPDGNDTEWTSFDMPVSLNLGHVVRDAAGQGQYIWADCPGDERTDFASPDTARDLLEFRVASDCMFLYFMVRLQSGMVLPLAPTNGVQVQIAIDTDQTEGSGQTYMAGFSDTQVSHPASPGFNPMWGSAEWEYLVETRMTFGAYVEAPIIYDQYFNNVGSAVSNPIGNVLEIRVPWYYLGDIDAAQFNHLRFTVGIFKSDPDVSIDCSPGECTHDLSGVSDALDAISNYGTPGVCNQNTWQDVQDGVIDYHFDVWFDQTCEVATPVQIKEIYYDGVSEPADEFLKIHNVTPFGIPLEFWKIGDEEQPGGTENMGMFPSGTIPADTSYIIAYSGNQFYSNFGGSGTFGAHYEMADSSAQIPNLLSYTPWAPITLAQFGNSGDEALLIDPLDTIMDVVAYEGASYPGVVSNSTGATEGRTLKRHAPYLDTNDCSVDFTALTPKAIGELGCQVDMMDLCISNICEPAYDSVDGPLENTRCCEEACSVGATNECCVAACDENGACVTYADDSLCTESCGANELTLAECAGCGANGAEGVCTTYRCDDTEHTLCEEVVCGATTYVCTNAGGSWEWRENLACDDGEFCTTGEICDAGMCTGGTPTDCSGSADQCNAGVCNETDDVCEASAINEGNACDDGLFCNTGETCQSGSCTGGTDTDCSQYADQCNEGLCNETSDSCYASPINEGGSCDDGQYCTIAEACNNGTCTGGIPTPCMHLGDDCNEGLCDELNDRCYASPINEGIACNDGLFCNTGETCQSGSCTGGSQVDCSELDDQCNEGLCNPANGYCYANPINEGNSCDDDKFCTVLETCQSGSCTGGSPTDCSQYDNQCNEGVCDDETDSCTANPINEGNACDDGFFCISGETCQSGSCTGGTPTDCSAYNDTCTTGACAENEGGCYAVAANEGGACDDGLFCNSGETCQSGSCTGGTNTDCSQYDNDCTEGLCNETDDVCYAGPINEGGACDDKQECTTGTTCQSGSCIGGNPVDCAKYDTDCTEGTCVEGEGCVANPINEGNACDDTLFCTSGETCQSGACTGGNPTDCSAYTDACTTGACGENEGGCYAAAANEGGACDDQNICTDTDVCANGVCAGDAISCADDTIACTVESCDETDGCISTPDDSLCDDDEDCTVDSCDSTQGCLHPPVSDWTICGNGVGDACFSGACEQLADNDSCDTAAELTLDVSAEDDLWTYHAYMPVDAQCDDSLGAAPDAFYTISLDTSYTHQVTVTPDTGVDVAVVIYTACDDATSCIAVMDDAGIGQAEVIDLPADQTKAAWFEIQVLGIALNTNDEHGRFAILVEQIADVDGDMDADADDDSVDGDVDADADDDSVDGDVDGDADEETIDGDVVDGDADDDTVDGDVVDGDTPDGDQPDGDTPDGDTPDGDQPDGDTPDGDTPDGDTPDGDTPDGDEPDGDTPDGDDGGGGGGGCQSSGTGAGFGVLLLGLALVLKRRRA